MLLVHLTQLVLVLQLFCYVSTQTVTVNVPTLGDIIGNKRTHWNEFLGIKFADAARFEDPQPVCNWVNPYDATKRKPMCFQHCQSSIKIVCQTEGETEDCLFLNIFTPKQTGGKKLCVMLFIHGGNFDTYSGGSILFDGRHIVKEGKCLLVTINYRLGAFGFLGTRNLGIKDQISALKWVAANIAYFGGDEKKITVFGQSAGAQSVGLLMSIPEASQYMQNAILQSAPVSLPFRTAAQGTEQETQLVGMMGCAMGNLTCYKEADPNDIIKWQKKVKLPSMLLKLEVWGPVIDGVIVKNHLYNLFTKGNVKTMPTIIGTVSDEATGYIYNMFPSPLNGAALSNILKNISTALSPTLLRLMYDVYSDTDKRVVLSKFATDFIFYCSNTALTEIMEDATGKTYNYIYDQVFPYPIWGKDNVCNSKVCHGIDLPVVFGTYLQADAVLSKEETNLSHSIMKYWGNFARAGNPAPVRSPLPKWSSYRRYRTMMFRANDLKQTLLLKNIARCKILKTLLGGYGAYPIV